MKSSYVVGHDQIDGRHYVIETHILDSGEVVLVEFLAGPDADLEQILADRVIQIVAMMEAHEQEVIEAERAQVAERQLTEFVAQLQAAETKGIITEESLAKLREKRAAEIADIAASADAIDITP